MDTPFIYDKFVTGRNFIGRKEDCIILENLLLQGEHIAMYSPPKSGKMSVIQQTLFNMRMEGKRFMVGQFSAMSVRTLESFLLRLGAAAMRTMAQTPQEFSSLVDTYLAGTHFVFDPARYSGFDEPVSLGWTPDEADVRAMLNLPFALSSALGQKIILIIDEFEMLMEFSEGESLLKAMEGVLRDNRASSPGCSFILTGSRYNAMKKIFEEQRYFYRLVEKFHLRPVSEKDITDHVIRGFLSGGKVVDRELLLGMCKLFRNNLWYINHFVNICDSLSKGYIVEATLLEALDCLVAIHEPRFKATMASLTTFQINYLKALLDGNVKCSSADVRSRYNLNSSANVKRLREALVHKEVITFDEKDEPSLPDPLFEYWVRKYYFEMKV